MNCFLFYNNQFGSVFGFTFENQYKPNGNNNIIHTYLYRAIDEIYYILYITYLYIWPCIFRTYAIYNI